MINHWARRRTCGRPKLTEDVKVADARLVDVVHVIRPGVERHVASVGVVGRLAVVLL